MLARATLVTGLILGTTLAVSQSLADNHALTLKQQLQGQNAEFEKKIYEVAPGIYTGVGYAGSNASMVVGDDGVVFIDTLPAVASATELHADFRKISDKPVKAIIYTHGHVDHVGGAKAFAGDANPAIYARQNLSIDAIDAAKGTIFAKRGVRQFGRTLQPGTERINLGVGPAVQPMGGFGQGILPATNMFDGERQEITVAGVTMELVQAPGETDDQLYVWLPESQVLFSGDNFYSSFPNLYAIRGGRYRDVTDWAESVDKMSQEPAVALVPGHTRPILGTDKVHQALTDYRDAIRFVHDKTLEGMNKGMTPDELVDYVKLPAHLADRPYLTEFYGRVDAAVRAIFNGYLGWFEGNPTELTNLSPRDEAQRVAQLVGGEKALLARLDETVKQKDYPWALRLADHLIALDTYKAEATAMKIRVLRTLADDTLNAPTRNYFLTVAQELEK